MNRNKITFIIGLFFVLLFSGCSKSSDKNKDQKEIVDVFAVESIQADVNWDIVYPAKVSGVKVKAMVSGTLKEITYKQGEPIEKGAQMFVVDKQAYRAAYDRASVVFERTKEEYDKNKSRFSKSKAQFEKGSIKKKNYDEIVSAYKKTESEYNDAKVAMKEAEIQLQHTRVNAPVSGIAGVAMYNEGTEISAVDGTDVLTYISNANPLKVTFFMPEDVVNNFMSGFLHGKAKTDSQLARHTVPIDAILEDGSIYPERGGIVFFNSKSEAKKGWVAVEAEFLNPGKKKIMIPGNDINVKIVKAAYKGVVVVLKTCIFKTSNDSFVFVVQEDNTVAAVPVQYETYADFAYITSGLKGRESVVSYASGSIEAGKTVNVKKREFVFPEEYKAEIVPFTKAPAPRVKQKSAVTSKKKTSKPQTSSVKKQKSGSNKTSVSSKRAASKPVKK